MVSLFIRLAVIATLFQASLVSMPLAQHAPDFWPPASAQSTEEIETLKGQVASLYEAGQYANAVPLLRRLLTFQEKTFGREHLDVAYSLYYLAESLHHQMLLADAEPLYKRALAIREKALGADHPDVAEWLTNLAALYFDQGRYADAGQLFKRALAIREKALGADHPGVAESLTNLAALYFDQGRYADALPLVNKTILGGFASKSVALPVLFNSQGKSLILADRAFEDSLNVIQRASQSSAAAVLNKLSARFSAGTDRLAQLVRKDQDLTAEAERLDKAIVEAVSREPSKRDSITEQRIRDRLDSVSRERKGLQDVFAWEFPNYAALSKPEPLTAKEIQSLLDADEALVVFDLDQHSYVWVVTKDRADWKEIQIPAAQASKTVETLRAALNPNSPKPYDRALAYQLYQHLFAPVEEIIS